MPITAARVIVIGALVAMLQSIVRDQDPGGPRPAGFEPSVRALLDAWRP